MVDKTAIVLGNEQRTQGLWQLVLQVESIPELAQPGQFVHLQLGDKSECILRRPLSIHDVRSNEHGNFDRLVLLYQVVGKGTDYLTSFNQGDALKVLGPIGRPWRPPHTVRRALLVGGGVGWAPLALLAGTLQAHGVEVHALVGAKNEGMLSALDDGATHRCPALQGGPVASAAHLIKHWATDDGSRGHQGFTTEVVPELLATYSFDYIATCGPEPMQAALAHMAAKASIPCEVSLERRMACGIGACLSCVVDTVHGKRRACVDGPVFDAQEVCW